MIESERSLATRLELDRTIVHKVYERLEVAGILALPQPGGRLRRITSRGHAATLPKIIAVVLPVPYSDYIGVPDARQRRQTFLNGIVDQASIHGCALRFIQLPPTTTSRRVAQQECDQLLRGLSGIIHLGIRGTLDDVTVRVLFEHTEIPQVCLAGEARCGNLGSVSFSPTIGLQAAASCFLEHGYRELAVIFDTCGRKNDLFEYELQNADEAVKIFRAAGMICHSNQIYMCPPAPDFMRNCRETVDQFLSSRNRPEAIWCRNDRLAVGLQKAFIERGISLPEEIAMIGMDDDDVFVSQNAIPPLTTLRLPFYECGRKSVDMLLDVCNGKEPEVIKLPPVVIERDSVNFRMSQIKYI